MYYLFIFLFTYLLIHLLTVIQQTRKCILCRQPVTERMQEGLSCICLISCTKSVNLKILFPGN